MTIVRSRVDCETDFVHRQTAFCGVLGVKRRSVVMATTSACSVCVNNECLSAAHCVFQVDDDIGSRSKTLSDAMDSEVVVIDEATCSKRSRKLLKRAEKGRYDDAKDETDLPELLEDVIMFIQSGCPGAPEGTYIRAEMCFGLKWRR